MKSFQESVLTSIIIGRLYRNPPGKHKWYIQDDKDSFLREIKNGDDLRIWEVSRDRQVFYETIKFDKITGVQEGFDFSEWDNLFNNPKKYRAELIRKVRQVKNKKNSTKKSSTRFSRRDK